MTLGPCREHKTSRRRYVRGVPFQNLERAFQECARPDRQLFRSRIEPERELKHALRIGDRRGERGTGRFLREPEAQDIQGMNEERGFHATA